MTLRENVRIGLLGLTTHKLRSFLTMLGIIFGVGAVVAMQSIGAGARKELLEAIKLLGVNNVIVQAAELEEEELQDAITRNPRQLNTEDARALREVLGRNVRHVVPVRRDEVNVRLPEQLKATVVATSPEYAPVHNLRVVSGRFLRASDVEEAVPVAVITSGLKRELFPISAAEGKRVKLGRLWFTVVGVVEPPGGSTDLKGVDMRSTGRDVYVPLSAAEARLTRKSETISPLQEIVMQVRSEELVRGVSAAAGRLIERRHRGAEDYSVVVPIELLKQSQQTQRIFNIVMGAIASISLLVGGIGIMNIMLSNVLERTREIGVRRAVGARQQDVVSQFLIEAVLLSVIGGVIGIVFGTGMAWGITLYAGWTTVVGVWAVVIAFGVSAGVGILFGWWPANKAAKMDVINALRYE
jgi:putative ABC transport system permease protein